MFLQKIIERNENLLRTAFQFHQEGRILPDTYLVDMDSIRANAKKILAEASAQHIELYFMLKQVGRNPYIAKALVELGYMGAVVVDFKEAAIMMKHHIPIANVGHLVQVPKAMLQRLVEYDCQYYTVFSFQKIIDLNTCAKKANKVVQLLLKVVGDQDLIYSGQTAGFYLEELPDVVRAVKELNHVVIKGVTSFPCFLYDEQAKSIEPTPNLSTLAKAKEMLSELGIEITNMNAPSTTSVATLRQMGGYGIHSAEPGHGLSGTTPLHGKQDCDEVPAVVYISEISHNFNHMAYCYGGGFYRRSHVKNALVGTSIHAYREIKVIPPNVESIDYYFGLKHSCAINDTVVMAFRFQIFVTRSTLCIVEGIQRGKPSIVAQYTSQGELIDG